MITQQDAAIAGIAIPKMYAEAMAGPYRKEWKGAMDKEIKENCDRNVFTLVQLRKPFQSATSWLVQREVVREQFLHLLIPLDL
jgi:hypothetical protein